MTCGSDLRAANLSAVHSSYADCEHGLSSRGEADQRDQLVGVPDQRASGCHDGSDVRRADDV